ncbi:MAG: hypothetical protein JSS27_05690 [Planctomycetes bacterium]|nr:hypothetical protein [Planctomycetota bacterium]
MNKRSLLARLNGAGRRAAAPRRGVAWGVTLVELLVVVAIVLSISLVVLKTLPPALESRNVREAARLVNVFLNTGRARAAESNRPSGVWLDRMPGLPEACVSMFYAQVPEVYSGAFSDSEVEAFTIPYYDSRNQLHGGNSYFANVVRPCRKNVPGANLSTWYELQNGWGNPDPTQQQIVKAGDLICFNLTNRFYRLDKASNMDRNSPLGSAADGYWCIGITCNKNYLSDAVGSRALRFDGSGNAIMNDFLFNSNPGPMLTPNSELPGANPLNTTGGRGQSVPFQIYRQPQRISAGGVTLPESTIIDLNFSGPTSSLNGAYFLPPFNPRFVTNAIRAGTGVNGSPALPQNPYTGYSLDINGIPIPPGTTANVNYDTTPIIIVFSPNGSVSQVYCRTWEPITKSYRYLSQTPAGVLYFLIGKRDKVPATIPTDSASMATASNSLAQQGNNWTDPTNLWVALNCNSGMVTTSPIWTPMNTNTTSAAAAATTSTQVSGSYSAYVGPNYPSGYMDAMCYSRLYALQGVLSGGR